MDKIPKESINGLISFYKKFKEIESSNFFKYFLNQKGIKMNQSLDIPKKTGTISLNEPNEENIDAFLIHFRQFHLSNDNSSLKYLKKKVIIGLPPTLDEEKNKIEKLIKRFENSLKEKPPIVLNITVGGNKLNLDTKIRYIKTFFYGGKIHSTSNSKERPIYEYFHTNSDEGFKPLTKRFYRFNVYSIILEEISILNKIYILVGIILDKIIKFLINKSDVKNNDNKTEDALKLLKNAYYISRKLEIKSSRAEICDKISEIYRSTGDTDNFNVYASISGEIKRTLKTLPQDFLNDPFFNDFFKMPEEYRIYFEKILPLLSLDNKTVIIITLDCLAEIKKFEKILNFRNFSYVVDRNILKLNFSAAIMKNKENIIYIDKIDEINISKDFGYVFPATDDKYFIVISNSPKMAFLNYLYMIGTFTNNPITHFYIYRILQYIGLLISIELNIPFRKPIFDDEKKSLTLNIDNGDIVRDSTEMIKFMNQLIAISYFPRIQSYINFEPELSIIKMALEREYKRKFKGLAYFRLGMNIFLYTIMTNDRKYIDYRKDMRTLFNLLEEINSKDITIKFYENLILFIKNTISKKKKSKESSVRSKKKIKGSKYQKYKKKKLYEI